jgi:hypothetical integral membrane protein (TIGR02206 family)
MTETARFVLFSPVHFATMAAIAVVSIALPLLVRRTGADLNRVGRILAVVVLGHEVGMAGLRVSVYGLPLATQLPLDFCSAGAYLSAYLLWKRSFPVYEVLYFWAFGGTLQAIVTPDLLDPFPHVNFFAFFLGHGLIIVSVLYATLGFHFRPQVSSIAKAIAVTLAFTALVAPLNYLLDTNYLYLRHKPDQASLMDYMGPWPWYVPVVILVGIGVMFLCYLPFFLMDWSRRRGT